MDTPYSVSSSEDQSAEFVDEMITFVTIPIVSLQRPDQPTVRSPRSRYALLLLRHSTIEELFQRYQSHPQVIHILNEWLLDELGVYVARLTCQPHRCISVSIVQYSHFQARKCRYNNTPYFCSQVLQWAFGEHHATLQWAIDFWNRDFTVG